ncbi:MAG: DUF6152 family protein [Woeseiaceae bacterium]
MSRLVLTGLFVFGLMYTVPGSAHHSFAATFTEEIIVVEGVVDRVKFTNPHVIIYFDVTDGAGEVTQWLAEGGSATSLRNAGWSKDTVSKGALIRVTGSSSRNGSPMVSMQEAGSVAFLDPETGAVTGSPWGEEAEVQTVSRPLQLANGWPNMTGAWTGEATGRVGAPIDNVPPFAFNEVGAAIQAEFDPVNDPQVWCEPPGLVRQAGFTPHPVRIQQFSDRVVLSYEEYGGVRKVFFDDRDHDSDEKTHLGQSIARYEGQKLIIESENLLPNLSATNGNLLSDQTTTVETYYREDLDDGRAVLKMDLVATDPGHLTAPWKFTWGKYAEDDYEFIEVECEAPLKE